MFQRRGVLNIPKVARESFYRNWREYENGFGSVRSDYWLGKYLAMICIIFAIISATFLQVWTRLACSPKNVIMSSL